MTTLQIGRAFSVLAFMSMVLMGQAPQERDSAPLKHWQAPLYWLSKQAEARGDAAQAQAQSAATPLVFVAATPCRIMDTRSGSGFPGAFGPPSLEGFQSRTIPIPSSSCGIPSSPAYSLNFTLISTYGPVGFLAAWPDDEAYPGTSITNAFNGGVVANAAVVPAGADGGISVMVTNPADLVIDINGYYAPAPTSAGTNATMVNGAAVPLSATFTGTNSLGQFTSLTAAGATASLNTFTSTLNGLVPSSGGGTTNFLRADGAWAAPPSGSGATSTTITLVPGSAGAPSLNFSGDATSGLYSSAAGDVSLASSGQNALSVDPTVFGSPGVNVNGAGLWVWGYHSQQLGPYGYLNSKGSTGTVNEAVVPVSIVAAARVMATEFDAYSDERIKQVTGRSDTQRDLEAVRQLRVTDYRYIDTVANGSRMNKGFLAQEVSNVIPEAVSTSPSFLPTIYALATAVEFDASQRTLTLTLANPHQLAVGDKVRIYTAKQMAERTVTRIPSERQFVLPNWDEAEARVFVYGKYVTDSLALDYSRLFTTGIGAIQELARQSDAKETRIAQLESDVAELKTMMNTLAPKLAKAGK